MIYPTFSLARSFLVPATHNSDILQFVTELAENQGITVGCFTAIGALRHAKLGFYDQEKHEYPEILLETPHEIASCVGNISIKERRPFVHTHAVLADKDGTTKAGHLLEAIVFAAEVHLYELTLANLEREYDEITGLSLWKYSTAT